MGIKLKDIADACGVSEGTASLAINNRPGVNEETKEYIRRIARKMGYFPNANAKGLAERKTGLIGVLVPNIENLFYSKLVRNVEEYLRKLNYKMILATTNNDINYEQEMIERFISFRVEGAIIYPMIKENPNPDYLKFLDMNDIPFVFIGSYYNEIKAPSVMSDLYSSLANAIEYLYHTGCRSFYYLGGCKSIVSNRIKRKALRETLQKYNLVFSDRHYLELRKTNYHYAFIAAEQLMKSKKEVDAILCADAYTAIAVYNVIRQYNLEVPTDISIINFDNILLPEICAVKLTCIEQNVDQLVEQSIKILQKRMENNSTNSEQILVETKLIVRETTK